MFNKTDIAEKQKGILVLSLAKIKLENIFIKENAGSPREKNNKALAEFLTVVLSKDPQPNNEDTISSFAIIRAIISTEKFLVAPVFEHHSADFRAIVAGGSKN